MQYVFSILASTFNTLFLFRESHTLMVMDIISLVLLVVLGFGGTTRRLFSLSLCVYNLALGTFLTFTSEDPILSIFPFATSVITYLLPSEGVKKQKNVKMSEAEEEKLRSVRVYSLTSDEFEKLIKELLNSMKGRVIKTLESQDMGVDFLAEIEGKIYVVLARRYRGAISVKLIRRLFERMLEEEADRGMFITTSEFSLNSYRFIEGKPVDLIDGKKLRELLRCHLKIILDMS